MFRKYMLMNTAGGIGDGGGSGDAGDPPSNSDANTGDQSGQNTEFSGPEWAKGWEGVEPEFLNDPALKAINNPASLLKSYVHAQRNIGKKGVLIPTENSPKEEWDQFYQKVGVPLEETKYKESLKLPEDKVLGDEFNSGFLKLAHETRILPTQAAKVYEYINTQVKTTAEREAAAKAESTQAELNALAEELGSEAYGVKLNKATTFLKEHAGEDFVKFLGESGLGKNAKVVKAFMNMADKMMKEERIPGGDSTFGMTKADLEREINKVMGDFNDPYHKVSHPDHKRRVDEVQTMFSKLEK
jgi:hypothetical protein